MTVARVLRTTFAGHLLSILLALVHPRSVEVSAGIEDCIRNLTEIGSAVELGRAVGSKLNGDEKDAKTHLLRGVFLRGVSTLLESENGSSSARRSSEDSGTTSPNEQLAAIDASKIDLSIYTTDLPIAKTLPAASGKATFNEFFRDYHTESPHGRHASIILEAAKKIAEGDIENVSYWVGQAQESITYFQKTTNIKRAFLIQRQDGAQEVVMAYATPIVTKVSRAGTVRKERPNPEKGFLQPSTISIDEPADIGGDAVTGFVLNDGTSERAFKLKDVLAITRDDVRDRQLIFSRQFSHFSPSSPGKDARLRCAEDIRTGDISEVSYWVSKAQESITYFQNTTATKRAFLIQRPDGTQEVVMAYATPIVTKVSRAGSVRKEISNPKKGWLQPKTIWIDEPADIGGNAISGFVLNDGTSERTFELKDILALTHRGI